MSAIDLQDVCLYIEGKLVLNQLCIETQVKRLGVIGRNGSGKSTPVSYTHLTLPTISSV